MSSTQRPLPGNIDMSKFVALTKEAAEAFKQDPSYAIAIAKNASSVGRAIFKE